MTGGSGAIGMGPAAAGTPRLGSRVRLRPRPGADIFDLALAGRIAEVVAVEQDMEGRVHVAVALDGDPGRDLGASAQIGHRFFFAPAELEPLDPLDPLDSDGEATTPAAASRRVLVAGVGNVFLADDAFGPEVAALLLTRPLPAGVRVADYGIRGMDLAYELVNGYDAAVLLDAAARGHAPGTLSLIEPDLAALDVAPDAHAMDPVRVLALAQALGTPPRTLVLGCEPLALMDETAPRVEPGLSAPVRAAVPVAADEVERLLADLLAEQRAEPDQPAPTGR